MTQARPAKNNTAASLAGILWVAIEIGTKTTNLKGNIEVANVKDLGKRSSGIMFPEKKEETFIITKFRPQI
jgi:hypothetical protein